MTSHRTISLTLTLLAVLVTVAPSSAFAGSLLSGYGGPGEGNQAILGSALLGGAGGGSGSSGGASGASGSSSSGPAAVGTQVGVAGARSGSGGPDSKAHKGAGRRATGGSAGSLGHGRETSGGTARAYPTVSAGDTSQQASVASQTLGLSGEDLAYILLAVGALAFTGILTRRLAQAPSRPEGP
jgi:hypothetical protein